MEIKSEETINSSIHHSNIPDCRQCENLNTLNCPHYESCYATLDRPYFTIKQDKNNEDCV